MARNKTLRIYNTSKKTKQQWTIHSDGLIDKSINVGPTGESAPLTLSGDMKISFGVEDTVYLEARYNYSNDSWMSETYTPNEITFTVSNSAVIVSSSYSPD